MQNLPSLQTTKTEIINNLPLAICKVASFTPIQFNSTTTEIKLQCNSKTNLNLTWQAGNGAFVIGIQNFQVPNFDF
jgi:hypothetical protein